jgi:5-oxoprolinase (ATP-hydrolysing)
MFHVGPESTKADPGPVCYRKGGKLAMTDANLLLGRIRVDHFPKTFGPGKNQPLDAEATLRTFEELAAVMNADGQSRSVDEIAFGFVRVANEAMARPIRAVTQMRGHDLTKHVLACFGGAGGQHAVAIARALGMRTVLVHRYVHPSV